MHAFRVQKGSFSLQNITKHYFNVFQSLERSMKRFHILGDNHGLKYPQLRDDITCMLFQSREDCFLSRTSPNILSMCLKVQNKVQKIFHKFGQNYGLTGLENLQFTVQRPCILFESRKDRFLSRRSPYIISMCLKVYKEVENFFHIFGQKYGLTPLENLPISDYITCMFSESRKDCFFIESIAKHYLTVF